LSGNTAPIKISLFHDWSTGLPDGFFSNQKSKFGQILEALEEKKLIYFGAIWNI
jgi:hypothetical protein